MVFILICLLTSPPDGLDSAQVLSNFQLQLLRLMALPGIEESSYLGKVDFLQRLFLRAPPSFSVRERITQKMGAECGSIPFFDVARRGAEADGSSGIL